MDARRFDRLTIHLTTLLGRQQFGFAALLGTILLAAGLGLGGESEAKKNGGNHKHKRKNNNNGKGKGKGKRKNKKCKKGALKCGKRCINPKTNALHCGGCGQRCGANIACVDGACQGGGCPAGQILCHQLCVDPDDNEEHCGRCNNACSDEETCQGGVCTATGCGAGERFCENLGLCIPDDDPNRCCVARDCGGIYENPYGSLECTAQGRCVCENASEGRCSSESTPAVNFLCDVCCGDGEGCPPPLVCSTLPNTIRCECPVSEGYGLCDGICTYVLGSDPQNCGQCDNVCGSGFVCRLGQCCGPTGVSCSQSFPDGCCSGLCHENGTCALCSSADQCPVIGQTCDGGRCCTPSGGPCFTPGVAPTCCSGSCVMAGHDDWRCA